MTDKSQESDSYNGGTIQLDAKITRTKDALMQRRKQNDIGPASISPRAVAASRWIRILTPLYSLLIAPVLFFCAWQIHSMPQPRDFKTTSDLAASSDTAREMKSHLDRHPELNLFSDRWYFDMMHDSVVETRENDSMSIEKRMNLVSTGYRDVFETHEEILQYLSIAALGGLFFSILVWLSPGVGSAFGLLLSSLTLTPPATEIFIGRDLSHLFAYSLPHFIVAMAIFGSALVSFAATRLTGRPKLQKGWTMIAWSTFGLLVGIGALIWIFAEGGHVRYQTGSGAGLLVVYGIWGIAIGTKSVLADRSHGQEKTPNETQT